MGGSWAPRHGGGAGVPPPETHPAPAGPGRSSSAAAAQGTLSKGNLFLLEGILFLWKAYLAPAIHPFPALFRRWRHSWGVLGPQHGGQAGRGRAAPSRNSPCP